MSKRGAPAALEPYFLYLILAAVGIGTALLEQSTRLAIVWTVMVLIGLAYQGYSRIDWRFSLLEIGRGVLVGLVIGVPLLAFLSGQLQAFTERIYGTHDTVLLFYQVCFIAAPAEELFFRGIVQTRKGISISVGLYAVMALIYFVPEAPLVGCLISFVSMGVLGYLYGYVNERYGLSAAVACHVTIAFLLQVTPSFIVAARAVLGS